MTPSGSRLVGRIVLVTGGSRGIGRAIARACAVEDARVVVAARSAAQVHTVAAEIVATGGQATAASLDVTDPTSVATAVARTLQDHGRIDVLVNNAGIHTPGMFVDQPMANWEASIDVNLFGTVRMTQAVLPGMIERGSGRIINIASTAGKYGSMAQSPYNAAKHAVVGLTRCLGLETAAHGVRVNAICPGFVETEMAERITHGLATSLDTSIDEARAAMNARIPIGRMITPEEVAELAVYLASDLADGMTGQAITLAGGLILI